jgi:hypothetical protein
LKNDSFFKNIFLKNDSLANDFLKNFKNRFSKKYLLNKGFFTKQDVNKKQFQWMAILYFSSNPLKKHEK